MRNNTRLILGLLGLYAATCTAPVMAEPIHVINHSGYAARGWNGYLGGSNASYKKKSNKLRFKHNAKIKKRRLS